MVNELLKSQINIHVTMPKLTNMSIMLKYVYYTNPFHIFDNLRPLVQVDQHGRYTTLLKI
jgi:hypothetical protein